MKLSSTAIFMNGHAARTKRYATSSLPASTPQTRASFTISITTRLSVASQRRAMNFAPARSEEHTSELQSQSNLVCRLLLEKKKKNNIIINSLIKEIYIAVHHKFILSK